MTNEFKVELRKAFVETTTLVAGAIAGGALGYLALGDTLVAQWVFPVVGAGIAYHALRHVRKAPRQNS